MTRPRTIQDPVAVLRARNEIACFHLDKLFPGKGVEISFEEWKAQDFIPREVDVEEEQLDQGNL